jgi:hypothetical protein
VDIIDLFNRNQGTIELIGLFLIISFTMRFYELGRKRRAQATMDQTEAIKRIWEANEYLWSQKIVPCILEPLERKGGLDTKVLWEHILATAFGRSLKTFESIQRLCDPALPRRLWDDAFVLTRSPYEIFVTLEWIAREPDARSEQFYDEYSLKLAHFLDLLGTERDDVSPERREEIYREREEVIKRHSRGPGTLRLLPTLEERVKDLAEPLKGKVPNLIWEYDFYYRDVSGFAHPSGWGIALSLSNPKDSVPIVEPSSRVGYFAVLLNGNWFFRILKCWNTTFKVVPDETIEQWHREWVIKSGVMET